MQTKFNCKILSCINHPQYLLPTKLSILTFNLRDQKCICFTFKKTRTKDNFLNVAAKLTYNFNLKFKTSKIYLYTFKRFCTKK